MGVKMVVVNLKNRFLFIALILLSLQASLFAAYCPGQDLNVLSLQASLFAAYCPGQDLNVTNIIDDAYQKLGLKNSIDKPKQTQTLAYLSNHTLYENLNWHFSKRVNELGSNFFKELFREIIEKEIEFKDDYYVFYHGQKREFTLPQDIYQGLYKIAYKKILHDFVMLRFPDKDFSKFGSVENFIKQYMDNGELTNHLVWFDTQPHVKKYLLSVNSTLFGNTALDWGGECSFCYFINSSNVTEVDVCDLVSQAFQAFKMNKYFDQYRELIKELNNLLGDYEKEKTGLLLQIFVPQKLVDEVAYRCAPGGFVYGPCGKSLLNKIFGGISYNPASKDLEAYKDCDSFDSDLSGNVLDTMQFRLLMNKKMLDPKSGVKIFKYCNETPNLKKYKTELKTLLGKIEQGYEKASVKHRKLSAKQRRVK